MDYTLAEIVNHKTNILNLSNNLFNTADVNQEITLNEELIKQAQFLLKLLNIKKNLIFGQNFQNNNMNNIFNPMQNNQMNMFNNINNNQFQQMTNQNIMNGAQELQRKEINLRFRSCSNDICEERELNVLCFTDEKISEVIKRYKNKAQIKLGNDKLRFIYNNHELNPNKTVEEFGLVNISVIYVVLRQNVIGG